MSNAEFTYNVAPRYSAGSPALVDERTADEVQVAELEGYARAMSGIYGAEKQDRARRLGLSGIVEHRQVFAHHFIATDRITGERRDSRNIQRGKPRPGISYAEADQIWNDLTDLAGKVNSARSGDHFIIYRRLVEVANSVAHIRDKRAQTEEEGA